MHIPDGYLSPATCAGLYLAAAPFWYVALRRLKHTLTTRMIPLVSVFAAFSFVIMMFNLPLPGGTTGHAVGMGIAAIVVGPWASIVAISVALLIQAVFFGDGGITAIGANCFNMAIAGSLVAYGLYRAIAFNAAIASARRVIAAGIAGYAAMNVAALLAAIEFGLQPLWFHDPSGAPLYAPYPLSVSIPAMMIGHLTIAGLAELVISAGLVAYLQRTDPGLLLPTARDAPDFVDPRMASGEGFPWPSARKLWLVVALLLVLTPLGILAAGNAWGEWSAGDFSDPEVRQQIAAASGNRQPPSHTPAGMERLSSVWTAPLSRYSPAWIRSDSFGYLVSAMTGVALIIVIALLASWLIPRSNSTAPSRRARRRGFIEKTARQLLSTLQQSLFAEDVARSRGLMQSLDARVKLAGVAALIVAGITVHRLSMVGAIFAAAVLLAVWSSIPLKLLAGRIWLAVLAFTGLIALPAIFLTPGDPLYRLPVLHWTITAQGLNGAAFLLLRAETSATLAVILVLTTLWTQLLRALRILHVPVVLVVILGMTYRYIFLFLQIAQDMFEAREARLIGVLEPTHRRRLAAASAGVLLEKSLQVSGEVHMAMQARGFRGEIRLLEELRMNAADWLKLGAFLALAFAAVWLGR